MNENAPLQDRFGERARERRPCIRFQRRAAKMWFLRRNYACGGPVLNQQGIVTRCLDNFRAAGDYSAEHLATWGLLIARLLGRRRLVAVTVHRPDCRL